MSPREQQVEAFVRAQPHGVTKNAVAAMLGVSPVTAADYLYAVRKKAGSIDVTDRGGTWAVWCAIERREYVRNIRRNRPRGRIVSSVWDLAR